MSGQSPKSSPTTSEATRKSTSLPDSQGGHTRSTLRAGETGDLFGRSPVPAPRSRQPVGSSTVQRAQQRILCRALDELATSYARLADTRGLPMPATYGRSLGVSSPSAALASLLENRLREHLVASGSQVYEHRWKSSAMVLGLPICQLQASARRISVSDLSGWPTPNEPTGGQSVARAEKRGGSYYYGKRKTQIGLEATAKLAGWPTPLGLSSSEGQNRPSTNASIEETKELLLAGWVSPTYTDFRRGNKPPRPHDKGVPLNQQVAMMIAGWTTPQSHDAQGPGSAERIERHGSTHGCRNLQDEAHLSGWPTPDAREGRGGLMSNPEAAMRRKAGGHMLNLEDAVTLAGWATPATRDYKDSDGMATEATNPDGSKRRRTDQLPRQAFLTGWGTPRASDADKNYRDIGVAIAEAERRGGNNRLGTAAISSLAQTERFGPSRTLNPAFSRWLMGFPPEWDGSAENSVDWLRWQVLMAPLSGELRTLGLRALGDMVTRSSHTRRLP